MIKYGTTKEWAAAKVPLEAGQEIGAGCDRGEFAGHSDAACPECGNCWHACQPFDVPPLGDHVHCNHPVIEVRDSPPNNHGWGTLRDARETCPHWIPRHNDGL